MPEARLIESIYPNEVTTVDVPRSFCIQKKQLKSFPTTIIQHMASLMVRVKVFLAMMPNVFE